MHVSSEKMCCFLCLPTFLHSLSGYTKLWYEAFSGSHLYSLVVSLVQRNKSVSCSWGPSRKRACLHRALRFESKHWGQLSEAWKGSATYGRDARNYLCSSVTVVWEKNSYVIGICHLRVFWETKMETAQHVILFVIIISNNNFRGLFSLFEGLLEESFAACLGRAAYLPEDFAVSSPLLQLL